MSDTGGDAETILLHSEFLYDHWHASASTASYVTVMTVISTEIVKLEAILDVRNDLTARVANLIGDWLMLRRATRLRSLN